MKAQRAGRAAEASASLGDRHARATAKAAAAAADFTECSVRAVDPVRVAVLLHGPTGTLRHTLPSIQSNLLAPLMKMAHGATVDVFAHLVDIHDLADPAHPEAKTPYLPPAEAEPLAQLGPCRYRLAKAAELDAKYNLSSLVNLHAAEGAAPG